MKAYQLFNADPPPSPTSNGAPEGTRSPLAHALEDARPGQAFVIDPEHYIDNRSARSAAHQLARRLDRKIAVRLDSETEALTVYVTA